MSGLLKLERKIVLAREAVLIECGNLMKKIIEQISKRKSYFSIYDLRIIASEMVGKKFAKNMSIDRHPFVVFFREYGEQSDSNFLDNLNPFLTCGFPEILEYFSKKLIDNEDNEIVRYLDVFEQIHSCVADSIEKPHQVNFLKNKIKEIETKIVSTEVNKQNSKRKSLITSNRNRRAR